MERDSNATGVLKRLVLRGILLAGLWAGVAFAQEVPGCGNLRNHYGPFDYTDAIARRDRLPIVEGAHFTPQVAALVRGQSGDLMADIDYTLRAFPNHHGALASVSRYALSGGRRWPNPAVQSAECYFRRAVALAPADPATRVLFGNYLLKIGNRSEAREEYEEALALAPDSVDIAYNAGLFFVEVGDLDRASALAKQAYDQGYPLPGLKTRLEAADKSPNRTAEP